MFTLRCSSRNISKSENLCRLTRYNFSQKIDKKCLVFPGQGAQYVGMTKDIYDEFPYIKELIQECDDIVGYSLSNTMFNGSIQDLTQTIKAQPAVLIHSLSLLKVLQNEYNLFKPNNNDFQFAMGLSLGEYSALTASNCFNNNRDAIYLVDKRARAMQECCIVSDNDDSENLQQKMLAIMHDGSLTIDKLQEIIDFNNNNSEYVADIANYNSSRQIVISGHKYSLDKIQKYLKNLDKQKYKTKYINTGGAFHSSLMKPAKEKLEKVLSNIDINLPFNDNTILANVDATIVNKTNYKSSEIIKKLLCLQVCSSVNWYPSIIKCIKELGVNEFIEIGPKATISGMIRDICKVNDIQDIKISNFDKLEDLKNIK